MLLKKLALAAFGAVLVAAMVPSAAMAGRYSDYDRGDRYRGGGHYSRGHDRSSFSFSFGYSSGYSSGGYWGDRYCYRPAPVYVPPPVYVAPAPVYVAPAPVVIAPAPVYCPPPVVYSPRYYYTETYRPSSYFETRFYYRD